LTGQANEAKRKYSYVYRGNLTQVYKMGLRALERKKTTARKYLYRVGREKANRSPERRTGFPIGDRRTKVRNRKKGKLKPWKICASANEA